ncbi:MAG: 3-deoxy-D-manno-octulosonic acid transferase [Marinifilaceae bacterium]|jgi:3-deoxy-D-manno-octulosonic-acid transferase|nr:3-deoxy-D-manno-octulosonic acid transferase [Marinifilaceae bacterium]
MKYIYTLGIRIYYFIVLIVSVFNKKAKLWIDGRKNIFSSLKNKINPNDNIIWIHAASVGEFEQAREIIEVIKAKHTEYKILLTFFSPSGYELRKNYDKVDYVSYIPIDTKYNAKKFLDIVNPDKIFFVKYEIWCNILNEVSKRKIPTFLISAIFRHNQIYFKKWANFYRNGLISFSHIFVQNKNSLHLLKSINYNNVSITGDTRFDRVYKISQESAEIEIISSFKSDKRIILAGSTWPKDEDFLVEYINKCKRNDIKYIIAPHEINSSHIKSLESKLKVNYLKYTESDKFDDNEVKYAKLLIIDCIGILSSAYKYGNIAYIGGGFGAGIHNILEAATFGLPVIFGPKHTKFAEALELIDQKGAFTFTQYFELEHQLDTLVDDKKTYSEASTSCLDYVKSQIGAVDKIMTSTF